MEELSQKSGEDLAEVCVSTTSSLHRGTGRERWGCVSSRRGHCTARLVTAGVTLLTLDSCTQVISELNGKNIEDVIAQGECGPSALSQLPLLW